MGFVGRQGKNREMLGSVVRRAMQGEVGDAGVDGIDDILVSDVAPLEFVGQPDGLQCANAVVLGDRGAGGPAFQHSGGGLGRDGVEVEGVGEGFDGGVSGAGAVRIVAGLGNCVQR